MADTRISDLTANTTPAAGDLVPVVDVSDTTMAASGTTKRMTLQQIGAMGTYNTGATLPASPVENQLFMHAPTGRRVLLVYTNSAWYPLYSFGAMTVYVDGTNGTDAADKGTGTGTAAYKTLSYMWTQLPSVYYGNITVNVSADTYTETLTCEGKRAGGNYSITITGTEGTAAVSGTMTSAVQGTGATPGSITDTGLSMTVDAYKGYYIKYGSTIRVIKSNTADTFTIAGAFTGTPSGAYTVFEPGTVIDGGGARTYCIEVRGMQSVTIQMMKLSNPTSYTAFIRNGANATLTNISMRPASTKTALYIGEYALSLVTGASIKLDGSATAISLYATATFIDNSFIWQGTGTKSGTGMEVFLPVSTNVRAGTSFDNFANGVIARNNSVVAFPNIASSGYTFITNCTTGIIALTGGQVNGTANNQYSGNTTNENAVSASYGYID